MSNNLKQRVEEVTNKFEVASKENLDADYKMSFVCSAQKKSTCKMLTLMAEGDEMREAFMAIEF